MYGINENLFFHFVPINVSRLTRYVEIWDKHGYAFLLSFNSVKKVKTPLVCFTSAHPEMANLPDLGIVRLK